MDSAALLAWYRAHKRAMPWREEVTPYRTLVSELMLQQTRVETVIPYFHRFMSDFPTVEALAAAPIERVLERWAGLGYYSRARNLHAAAQAIVAAGGFPRNVDGLRALPGVGPYTAGAVASIAMGADVPLVDGNVERVLCRQLARAEDPKKIHRELWAEAARILPAGEAGDFNQALMELGATLCTPKGPACLICPVRSTCRGVDAPERYPAPRVKAAVPEAEAVAAVVRSGDGVLLAQRPPTGLLGGLWEPPAGPGSDLGGMVRARLGAEVAWSRELGRVLHVFSHLRLYTTVWEVRLASPARVTGGDAHRVFPPYVALQVVRTDPPGLALSTLARKWLAVATEAHTPGTPPGARPRTRRAPPGPAPRG